MTAQRTAQGREARPIHARSVHDHQVTVEFEEPETRLDAVVFGAKGLVTASRGGSILPTGGALPGDGGTRAG